MPFPRRSSSIMRKARQIAAQPAAWTVAGLSVLGLAFAFPRPATSEIANPAVTPEQAAFFESKVRPILVENCTSCHGKDADMGGLRLDTRAALLKGGASGVSIKPGDPDHSLFITAIRQTGPLKMPQGGKLKPEEVAVLEEWVKMGAPWPEAAGGTPPRPGSEDWRSFWSLKPVKMPALPKVKNKNWVSNPIDAFVLAKLEEKGLTPAPAADRRTLIRRVTFDLTGLPPTPGEVEAFQADKSPNAYEKVVDRLLASPRYGEYQARHWLDVARYADTKGYVFNEDRNYPNAYTFRDWVIQSFNEDLPYDKFLTYQLAADLAPEVKNGDDKRPLAALGFLTVGRRFLNNQADIMDDRIDVTMRGFEGMTVACARCHDHKFDPIPTADYYSLYGVFANSPEVTPPISPANISGPWEQYNARVKTANDDKRALIVSETKRLREVVKATPDMLPEPVRKGLQAVRENAVPDGENLNRIEMGFTPEAKTQMAQITSNLDSLMKSAPQTPEFAMAVNDRDKPEQQVIFKRGNPGNRGDAVPRRLPVCLTPAGQPRTEWTTGSGRLNLAKALVSPDNPRTSRVYANRVWLYHFGFGLVRTPSDFGKQGEKPSNPELLDYLAAQFMKDSWSVKKLHRLIVLSSTYKQTSDVTPKALNADPENRLVSHQNRRRLDLEQMRDSLLFAAGKLDTKQVGGKSVDLWKAPFTDRRAVYGFIERQNLPGTFRTFDLASPDSTSAQRFRTTVPQQALFVMNSPFAAEQAITLASLPGITPADDKDTARRVRRLYLRLFDRLPDTDELNVALSYLNSPDPPPNALDTLEQKATPATWQYGFGGYDETTKRTSAFTPFTKFDADAGQWHALAEFPAPNDPTGYANANAGGGHPGRDAAHAVIRRWTAPRDMTAHVIGMLKHDSDQGDGVRARIVSSRLGLLGEWVAQHGGAKTEVADFEVKKGDTLDFITDCRTTDSFDSFEWSPVVGVAGMLPEKTKAVVRWDARKDFSGPPPAPPRPLTKWERYAQALLMTNEFMFVD